MNGIRPVNGTHGNGIQGNGTHGAAVAPLDWTLVAELRARVAERLDTERALPGRAAAGGSGAGRGNSPRGGFTDADERALAASLISQEIEQLALARATVGSPAADREAERALAAAVTAALFGMGRLQPLLDRDDVENVHIYGADRVVLELAGGRLEAAAPVAASDGELIELLTRWAARAGQTGREFSPAHPLLNLRLPEGGPLGSRLAAVMEVTGRPTVAIRRHRLAHVGLDGLLAFGTVTPVLHGFLRAAVRAGCNIVVSGAPAAGKTTLLRALASEIPTGEHVVTVEEEYELGLHVTDPTRLVTAMEARQANAEGVGGIGLHTLLTQALRHSPSRVLVGEVRGGEVTALLAALSNGAAGGMCTLHARSAPAVLTRVAQLAQLSDPPLPTEAAWLFVADAVDLIVHVDRDPADAGGARYVSQVLEVGAIGDGGMPDTTSVFAPDPADRRAVPAHSPSTGLRYRLGRAGFTTVPAAAQGPVESPRRRPAAVSQ